MQRLSKRNELGVCEGQKGGPAGLGVGKGESRDNAVLEMGKEWIMGAFYILQRSSGFILSVMGDQ